MNKATFSPFKRGVDIKVIRIESGWHFLTPYQTVNAPKERK